MLQHIADGVSQHASLRILDFSGCCLTDKTASTLAFVIRDQNSRLSTADWQYLLRSYPDERMDRQTQEQVTPRHVGYDLLRRATICQDIRRVCRNNRLVIDIFRSHAVSCYKNLPSVCNMSSLFGLVQFLLEQ